MNEAFKIYVDQLRDGHSEKIAEKVDSSFLEIHEEDLSFVDLVDIKGEAYLAENNLILHFDISTLAKIPCAICNAEVKVPINLKNVYHSIPASEIKTGIYNSQELLREDILLATPLFAECNEGQCPEREALRKFFRDNESTHDSDDEGYHPFAHL